MKRSDLIAAIAAESGCNKKDVNAMLDAFVQWPLKLFAREIR